MAAAAPAAAPPKIMQVATSASASPQSNLLDESRWQPLLGLPCQLTVDVPIPGFRVSDLLKLQVGSILATGWHVARDVPMRVNESLIGWSEFEVVNNRLAVRLTELA